jgi:dTDP-4-amino-4,6-dideoxygalactose transaminase
MLERVDLKAKKLTKEEYKPVHDELIERLGQAGVATNVHYKPLPLLSAYKDLGFDITDFPNALAQFQNEITLPLHTLLSDEDVQTVVRVFKRCKRQLEDEGLR